MILGITAQNHDASMALVDGQEIVWAAHSERYSRRKNDTMLDLDMVREMRSYGEPTKIVWFEKPIAKNLRRLYAGQSPWIVSPRDQLRLVGLNTIPVEYVQHHESHAAAGFYTSGFPDASVLVVDAVGEWNTTSIWHADNTGLNKFWNRNYPNSMGLFYTAFTQWLGLKPNEEEYILMGMSALGRPSLKEFIKREFFSKFDAPNFTLKHNLHRGCQWWTAPDNASKYDVAASVQAIMEEYLLGTVKWMHECLPSRNLVFMGGVALNCVANTKIAELGLYDNIWLMPNPGDAGSAIGAVAAYTKQQLNWQGPYLGTDIDRELDINGIVQDLMAGKVVAVANGRAEFGPRALGNRSLLCDPRGPDAKNRMNTLKRREAFRPFAPAILAEYADEYFQMPVKSSPYMQFVAQCKKPKTLPGICHVDGTSRVQTVTKEDNPRFRALLEAWFKASGCPILMNTSMNVKGEPLVNSWADALRWQDINGVQVF
jgi:carbamoyltransferase